MIQDGLFIKTVVSWIGCLTVMISLGCHSPGESSIRSASNPDSIPLFTSLSPKRTGITFANNLTEGLNTNVLMYEYFYNGGGVAVGDVNNDGREDLYFSGNMVPNRLYLNRGHMKFTDVTTQANVAGRADQWRTGVTMADVNGDGRLDIFVSYSGNLPSAKRLPQLLINEGTDEQGIPRFTDQTIAWHLDQPGQTTQSVFFDYDRDGDLDLFLLNHNPRLIPVLDPQQTAALLKQPNPEIGVRLLQNTGSHFTDVTDQSGLSHSVLSYGLGVSVSDVNGDGWPDLYISNDYNVPDYLYLNTQNGRFGTSSFINQLKTSIRHTSQFSMGNDIADVNNDALPDILTLDMLPEDNRRQKLLLAADSYDKFDLTVASGFHYQHMRNMLQLNLGNWDEKTAGSAPTTSSKRAASRQRRSASLPVPRFAETGQLAGVASTDWSWSPLLADYDNDGWKDLYITNGFVRDYTNQDFVKFMADYMQHRPASFSRKDVLDLVRKIPSSNVRNYMYRNQGDEAGGAVQFTDVGTSWGLTQLANSTGAAYADLDLDGDLDLIVNNTNQPAFILQNETSQQRNTHYLTVRLLGAGRNTQGTGAKLTLYRSGKQQLIEQMPARGYQSGMTQFPHFGLGTDAIIDSFRVVWPSGKMQLIQRPAADRMLTVREVDARAQAASSRRIPALFSEIRTPVAFVDSAHYTNDFKRQPLLVNAQSFGGPCMAKADVNGDGREDVYVGGDAGQPGCLFVQQANGQFSKQHEPDFVDDRACADTDAQFFDANADRFPDLYVSSGGYGDLQLEDRRLQDRLYLNDGHGHFTRKKDALPPLLSSKSCVRIADLNNDGKPDLFVGGRVVPGRYPEPPASFLLLNDGHGRFIDQTTRLAPMLRKLGMVTDAAWVDLNHDRKPELIVVGEWMPVMVLGWADNQLIDQTAVYFTKPVRGWWNRLLVNDLNGDGQLDLVVGNQGLNTQCRASDSQPAALVFKDFDNNGTVEPILCLYNLGKSYPHASRDELLDQIGMLRYRFTSYESYAKATLTDVFTADEMRGASTLTANQLQTTAFIRTPGGKFNEKSLPLAAQLSPVFTITPLDYDHDGHRDLLLCGNTSQARLRFGRSDANYGLLLRGNGKGDFKAVPQAQAGFQLTGDVRSVLSLGQVLLFAINQQAIRAYRLR